MCSQENVLLKKTGTDDSGVPQFAPKIADFGMAADEPEIPIASAAGDIAHDTVKHAAWVGTYLYMSPEATGLNAEEDYPKGGIVTERADPLFGASDSFSFGVMFLIMITRDERWYWNDGLELPSMINKAGKPEEDMQTIARWYYHGKRPQFVDDFPPMVRLLIEGCWADKQSDRLRFSEIKPLLHDKTIDWLHVEAAPMETYDAWLTRVGVADKKENLDEWDVREKTNVDSVELEPLEKLQAMLREEQDEDSEDFTDMLEDLFGEDSKTRATFTAAVEALVSTVSASGTDSKQASTYRAAVSRVLVSRGVAPLSNSDDQERTAREMLVAMLPATTHEAQIAELQEFVEGLKSELTTKDDQLAAKDEELALLRERLASFEREVGR